LESILNIYDPSLACGFAVATINIYRNQASVPTLNLAWLQFLQTKRLSIYGLTAQGDLSSGNKTRLPRRRVLFGCKSFRADHRKAARENFVADTIILDAPMKTQAQTHSRHAPKGLHKK
jgi:hypothetical protein